MLNVEDKSLLVELSSEDLINNKSYYSQLCLPTKDYEITDALQKLRAVGKPNSEINISILECPLLRELEDVRIDSPTIEELNFFAKRLDSLNEDEQMILHAVTPRLFSEDGTEPVSIKDLINITYDLDISVISNVWSDEQLGKFVIENDLNEDIASIPGSALYLLDRKQVGALQRRNDGGVFVGNRYILAGEYEMPEIYDGRTLPDTEVSEKFVFRLEVTEAPVNNSEKTIDSAIWINLPIHRDVADSNARDLNEGSIEDDVYYYFESSIPQINSDMFGDMLQFDELNTLAKQISEMSPVDQIKFKAVLSAEQPENMECILDVSKHLSEYELAYFAEDAEDFYKQYLRQNLDSRFDGKWLDTLLTRNEGERLIGRLGASVTDYGIISARGSSLYELVSYDAPEADFTQDEENIDYDQNGGMSLE